MFSSQILKTSRKINVGTYIKTKQNETYVAVIVYHAVSLASSMPHIPLNLRKVSG